MTREEAIAFFKDMNECTYGDCEPVELAIKALEEELVLDKIRNEIEQTAKDYDKFDDYRRKHGLWIALDIIYKYKAAESELHTWECAIEKLSGDNADKMLAIAQDIYNTAFVHGKNYRLEEQPKWIPVSKRLRKSLVFIG